MSTQPTSTFTVALRDEISATANKAAGTLAALQTKIKDDERALGELNRAMRRLKSGGQAGGDAFKELRDRATAMRAAIAGSQSEYLRLGGNFRTNATAARGFLEELSKAPGPLGAIAGRLNTMSQSLGTVPGVAGLAALGIAGVIAMLGALGVAIGTAVTALLSYGVAHANARRSELLHLEGLTTIRHYYRAAAGSATEMQVAIDRVSASSALGRSDVARYSEQLYRMGLRGQALSDALEGTVTVASVQGDQFARRFAGMAAGAARTGASVRRLADDVRTRLGGIATRQALALDVQMRHLQEGVASIFDGLRIEGFLSALNEITSSFSQSTITGRALRTLVSSLFNPLLDGAAGAGPIVRSFFEGMVIGALRLGVIILRVRNTLRDTFGDSKILGGIDGLRVATVAGTAVIAGLVGVAVTLTVVMATLAIAVGVVAAGLLVLSAPLLLLAGGIYAIYLTARDLIEFFRATDWSSLGTSIVSGLVNGLLRGRDVIVSTVRGLASSATATLREALGIRSPSRVFASLGIEIPHGLAAGVDSGAPAASRAVERMSDGASGSSVAQESPLGGAATAAASATSVGPFYIEVRGGDASEVVEQLESRLARIFEGLALHRGAPA